MKKKVFITFCWDDRKLMQRVYSSLKKSKILDPIVITKPERGNSQLWNQEKVALGIKECNYFVPIITPNSLLNQWVNQEIGYAAALNKEIHSIIEKSLLDEKKLKGWVNCEKDQPYKFELTANERTNRKNFRNTYKLLISRLEHLNQVISFNELTNAEKQIFANGEIVFYDTNSRHLFLNKKIYPLTNKEVYKSLKAIIKNKSDRQISKEEFGSFNVDRKIK